LGFEDLAKFATSEPDPTKVLTEHVVTYGNPLLNFYGDPMETKLFAPLGMKAHIFAEYPMTLNHHTWGLSPDKFETDEGLKKLFYPTSYCYDEDNQQFVGSMEAYDYPFFGT